jgi:hypothetical protein
MRKPLSTRNRTFDLDEASIYLATRLSNFDEDQTCRLAQTVGRATSTVQSWASGRTVPARNLWPKIGQFLGEGPNAMFDAASRKLNPPRKYFPQRPPEASPPSGPVVDVGLTAVEPDGHTLEQEIAVLKARIARLEEQVRDPRS